MPSHFLINALLTPLDSDTPLWATVSSFDQEQMLTLSCPTNGLGPNCSRREGIKGEKEKDIEEEEPTSYF